VDPTLESDPVELCLLIGEACELLDVSELLLASELLDAEDAPELSARTAPAPVPSPITPPVLPSEH